MSGFSQSFNLSVETLKTIEKEEAANKRLKNDDELEIIEESPNNKTKEICQRSLRRRNNTTVKFTRNKSDSILLKKPVRKDENLSQFFNSENDFKPSPENNLSAFFDSDIQFSVKQLEPEIIQNDENLINISKIEKMFETSDLLFSEEPSLVSENLLDQPISSIDLNGMDFEESFNELKGLNSECWKSFKSFDGHVTVDPPREAPIDEIVLVSENVSLFSQEMSLKETEFQFIDTELKRCKRIVKDCLKDDDSNISFQMSQSLKDETLLDDRSMSRNEIKQKSVKNLEKSSEIELNLKEIDRTKNLRLMSSWGLPSIVLEQYEKKGIKEMFEWQAECLSNPKILFENSNLVYSAPTSAGKTLISELLMIKNVLEKKKKALIILPFISVVREKMFYLQDLLRPAGVRVEGFFGGYTAPGGFEQVQVAICTIEKANSIINRLLEQNKLSDIGIIVVDEIHLISDPSRGYILELLLAKILYMTRKYELKIQIVTMSATLPNLELLQKWLNSEFYYTSFRPIELKEMIKIGDKIYNEKMEFIRKIETPKYFPKDQDNIGQMVVETINEGCSVIIFCPSKDWCETLCLHLAEYIYNLGKSKTEIGELLRSRIKMNEIEETKLQFKNCPTGLDSVLGKCISYGCSFHHAGLTSDERDIIESSFKSGAVKVIVCTSTLSSGVNLPARRVIIRTPLFGGKPMNSLVYRQMIGRAGRMGKDTLGESILICSDVNAKAGKDLICAKLSPISSCLDGENNGNLKRALLEIIASGVAVTKNDLKLFINCTLLCAEKGFTSTYFDQDDEKKSKRRKKQSTDSEEEAPMDPIAKCIEFLVEYEFIRLQFDETTNEMNYVPTRLGNACLASSIPPSDGFLLFSELQKSRQCFVLESELHAVYLVTPYSVCYQLTNIDWLAFLDLWERLPAAMRRVGELVGIKDSFLVKAMRGTMKLDYKTLQIHKRFYVALALQELVNESPLCNVASKYKLTRGLLQNLQQISSTFAGIVNSFCNSLNWSMLGLIVSQFKERLFFGIHHDLMDLMRVQNLNGQRARALFDKGIQSVADLANAEILFIENILFNCICFDSEKKRDGEHESDANQRNNIRNFYVTGKTGLSVRDAAKLLIEDARRFIELEMGVVNVKWTQDNPIQPLPAILEKVETKKDEDNIFKEPTPVKRQSNQKIPEIEKAKKVKTDPPEMEKNNISIEEIVSSQPETSILKTPRALRKTQTTRILRSSKKIVDSISIVDEADNISIMNSSHILSINKELDDRITLTHLNIVDVCGDANLFKKLVREVERTREIGFSVGVSQFVKPKTLIGGNLLLNGRKSKDKNFDFLCIFNECFYIEGISICFKDNTVYHLNFQKDENKVSLKEKIDFLKKLLKRKDLTLKVNDAKEQLKVLLAAFPEISDVSSKFLDPKIADWLLQPDSENNLTKMALQYAPEALALISLAGTVQNFSSFGLSCSSSVLPKVRCSIEACVTIHVLKGQLENLERIGNGNILRSLCDVEMPVQLTLVKMEKAGFSVKLNDVISLSQELSDCLLKLEQKIYQTHGRKFNLSSSAEVAKILGLIKNSNGKFTATKEVLQSISSPLSELILQYRKVGATLNRTIIPIQKNIVDNKIYGNSISFTSTGRISMQEPSLQTVAKDFTVTISENEKTLISCRNVFKTPKLRCLVSADFCQLELRILTHLSQDENLLKIMNSDKDVFKSVAAKWNRISESSVTDAMRQNTKQICYGIIYGMGNRTLSESLKMDERNVGLMVEQFHETYPGIRNYTEKVIKSARENEFVETLSGRRRYLPNINHEDLSIRNQAERQALNTTIQGTAADITKNAMLRMERNLKKYQNALKINNPENKMSFVDLVLHMHDELIYEVPTKLTDQVGKILKCSMENSTQLSVPLRVKLKVGSSWGDMKEVNVV